MKNLHIFALLAVLLSAVVISGCSKSVPASALSDLTRDTEASETARQPEYSEADVTISQGTTAVPETATEPETTTEPETVSLETVSLETVSLETLPPETLVPETTIPETTAAPDPYVSIKKFTGLTLEEAGKLFDDAGVPYTVVNEVSKYAAGTVISFNYFGYEEGDYYRLKAEKGAVLHVSLGTYPATGSNAVRELDDMTVYLTFDDGPTPKGTPDVLASLEKHNAKATFFLVGTFCEYYPDLVRQIYASGNVIGCHSYSHDYHSIYDSAETMSADIEKWEAAVKKILGELPEYKLYRFPGGSNTTLIDSSVYGELVSVLNEKGYRSYDWTMANNDKYMRSKPADQTTEDFFKESFVSLLKSCDKSTRPRISLMHDTVPETVSTLDWVLDYLTENGYSFGTLDELSDGWLF